MIKEEENITLSINITKPLSYAEYSDLVANSINHTALPLPAVQRLLVLQRGTPSMPYLRLFWKEGSQWFQRAPFVLIGGGDLDSKTTLKSLEGFKQGESYRIGSFTYRAAKICAFQYVFDRVG
ncbi:UNVERIFIED_CONTAM: hypothetical protein HDU68_006155 [Siphonaria sp. JEL0065]|nr:hypothetical protein HDU68_006155 [Siphonaria sp. JEL0065]